MLKRLTEYLQGSRDYRVPEPDARAAAAILMSSGATLRNMRRTSDALLFSLPLNDCAPVERILAACGLRLDCLRERGLCRLLKRYRKRLGIPVGLIIFCVILWLSEQFVWTVEVVGNESCTERAVLESLSELGFGVGSYIPDADLDSLHSDFLLANRGFAWIAVNIRGTHATVEVRETIKNQPVPDEDTPYNLVAAEDGIVKSIDIYRGVKTAEIGALVREGELLASGVADTDHGLRLYHARGRVMAEVKRKLRFEVPLTREVKVYTGAEYKSVSASILGFSVKLFKNTGNSPPMCDKIEREHIVRVFGEIELPITLHETLLREYVTEAQTVSEETARSEAFAKLRSEIAAQTGELLSRSVSAGLDGETYVLDCTLTLLSDIAREAEILR